MVYPRGNEDEPSPPWFAPTISQFYCMRWSRIFPMFMAFPALIQAQGAEVSPVIPSPIESEAQDFMDDYADDLRAGRRQSIIERYDKRGAYRVGEGQKILESMDSIRSNYMNGWAPPASFSWRDLSFEPLSADAIAVTGFFDWGTAVGKKLAFSYTGLLVRQDGVLRIRLEDESADPKNAKAPTVKRSSLN